MVEPLLDFMLGPMRGITSIYVEYQVIFNTLVVGFGIYSIFFSRKKQTANEAGD
ncbi:MULTISPECIES: hypothetical protein [Virgibacillus]|uniref:Uncharacterized protein n=2 Tax=Virgibacillus TaxID=84406 RepID=A0A024Q8E0_9BACI|nr:MULTISPECIES: hypothetical protein [Virgibacillus]EQB38033.1 hypothetical protein M948_05540 [Virgibacillus sp. CM-4]GGJ51492.1 hypothetical protein GCM10007111_12020 [Virgibacillus kapii]CDQ38455.1 hypothetical protein BN990_00725 [Virgibacillus massiliensis]